MEEINSTKNSSQSLQLIIKMTALLLFFGTALGSIVIASSFAYVFVANSFFILLFWTLGLVFSMFLLAKIRHWSLQVGGLLTSGILIIVLLAFEIRRAIRFKSIHTFSILESDFSNKDMFSDGQFSYLFSLASNKKNKIALILPFGSGLFNTKNRIAEYIAMRCNLVKASVDRIHNSTNQAAKDAKNNETNPAAANKKMPVSANNFVKCFLEVVKSNFKQKGTYKRSNLFGIYMLHALLNKLHNNDLLKNLADFILCTHDFTLSEQRPLQLYYDFLMCKTGFGPNNQKNKAIQILFMFSDPSMSKEAVSQSHGIIKNLSTISFSGDNNATIEKFLMNSNTECLLKDCSKEVYNFSK